MAVITPQWFMDFETSMSTIVVDEYPRLLQNQWWTKFGRTRPTQAGRDVVAWLLSTAMIHDEGEGGNIRFDDLVSQTTEMSPKFAGGALELSRAQLEDTDGNGMDLAAAWSRQMSSQMAYWPQRGASHFLKNAHDIEQYRAYDGKAFFAKDHPQNPYREQAGVYANLFADAAAGAYPGKLPIHGSGTGFVDDQTALDNLAKAYAYIAGIKMPNGVDPRGLRPAGLLVPPRLLPRATMITQAKFLSVAGGGSSDYSALISALGYSIPVQVDELAGFEDDTTYYIVAEQITDYQLGAMIYLERSPFAINWYGPQTQAQLNRSDRWEWHCKGRNSIQPGHPFLLFKVKGL